MSPYFILNQIIYNIYYLWNYVYVSILHNCSLTSSPSFIPELLKRRSPSQAAVSAALSWETRIGPSRNMQTSSQNCQDFETTADYIFDNGRAQPEASQCGRLLFSLQVLVHPTCFAWITRWTVGQSIFKHPWSPAGSTCGAIKKERTCFQHWRHSLAI